jgi:hypothetical protein
VTTLLVEDADPPEDLVAFAVDGVIDLFWLSFLLPTLYDVGLTPGQLSIITESAAAGRDAVRADIVRAFERIMPTLLADLVDPTPPCH